MDFKVLFETQSRFVNLINNSYKKNRLSQVYLLEGVKGTPKMQGAMFLANLLLCDTHDNCGQCVNCRLLEENVHPRLFKIEPTKSEGTVTSGSIKREQIDDLIKEFELTNPLTRVFIINEFDKATLSASNTLLKFLEEMKENCYGILITDNLNAVLDTIKSRTQVISFEKINKDILMQYYLSKSIDNETARVLCILTNNVNEGMELYKDSMIIDIIKLVKRINKSFFTDDEAIMIMNEDGKFLLNNNDKKYHQIFLDLLLTITNDRLFYLLSKREQIVFLETIEDMEAYGFDLHAIDYYKTFGQVETILEFKQKILYNVNLELMYMDLFIKCEV